VHTPNRNKNEERNSLSGHPICPLVTVIICTYNRHDYFKRALKSVLAQDIKDFEVIVVDDGSESPINLTNLFFNSISHIRIEHNGVGAARAAGLNAAKGTYVAYCDDDDEWESNHLSTLLTYITEHPEVDVVYADSKWIQQGAEPSVPYSVDYDLTLLNYSNYIFATDVLHRKAAAIEVGGFDKSLLAFEDWDLWLQMSEKFVFIHIPQVISTHHWNANSISASNYWSEWEKVYNDQKERLKRINCFHPDLIQNSCVVETFDCNTWQNGNREMIWHSIMYLNHSYGQVSRNLLSSLERAGIKITMAPTRNQPQRGLEHFYKPVSHKGKFAFYYDFRVKPSALTFAKIIHYSMWESTRVPQDHVDEINRSVFLQYVPCKQNVESFKESGVRVPIKVLHHGVDANLFPYLVREANEYFTFGSFSDFSPRKGIDVLVRAFQDEFKPGEPVRLLLKSTKKAPAYLIKDSRISLISGMMDQAALLIFLQKMDAFVLPSRGEGFGLTGLEAMSTGLPLIATNWSGPADYLDINDSLPLDYELADADGTSSNGVQYFGKWAEPDYEHLRYLMRWLYEHREEAMNKGKAASERVHRDWTWDRVAKQISNDLDELAKKN